jgi:hypothetical protein
MDTGRTSLTFAGQRLLESASDRTERGIRRVAIDTDLAALLNYVAQDHLPEGSLREAAADVFGAIAVMSSAGSSSQLGDLAVRAVHPGRARVRDSDIAPQRLRPSR